MRDGDGNIEGLNKSEVISGHVGETLLVVVEQLDGGDGVSGKKRSFVQADLTGLDRRNRGGTSVVGPFSGVGVVADTEEEG